MGALRCAAVAALLSCASFPAPAQDTVKWADVGAWPVIVDRTIGNGCFTYMEYETGTILRIGFDRLHPGGYIMIANQRWNSLEIGKEYDLKLVFGRAVPWNGVGTAIDMHGQTALLLHFDQADLIADFMQKQSVQLWYADRQVDHLSLSGSFAAFNEVIRCQQAMDGMPAQNGPADDPFSEHAKPVNDPFAM